MSRWKLEEVSEKTAKHREWEKTPGGKAYAERHKEYARQWRLKNKEKFHAKQKENYDAVRLEALKKYSQEVPVCACPNCGVKDLAFLTIDHIDGSGSEHRREIGQAQGVLDKAGRKAQAEKTGKKVTVGGNGFAYWLKKNNWPGGFQVLCMNCNKAKGKQPFCPVHGPA